MILKDILVGGWEEDEVSCYLSNKSMNKKSVKELYF